jgi:hypothetical protein
VLGEGRRKTILTEPTDAELDDLFCQYPAL